MQHPIYVIYHADCRDGFGAAWAAWTALGEITPRGNTVHYIPSHYGHPAPDTDPEGRVYILDFSYNLPTMTRLYERHQGRLMLLDHHASSKAELEGRVPGCHFDLQHSGAVMAWNYFHPGQTLPQLLAYVQDRDLWQWRLPDSRSINHALQVADLDFDHWSSLNIPDLLSLGRPLYRANQRLLEKITTSSRTSDILGTPVPSVESDQLVSDVGERMLELNPNAPYVAVYHHDTDFSGNPITRFSLRSGGRTDVSLIAKQLGGGGHAQASGFVVHDAQDPRPAEYNPEDTRAINRDHLQHLMNTPTNQLSPADWALAHKIHLLQLAADTDALTFAGDHDAAEQLSHSYGHAAMADAAQAAREFPSEVPVPKVALDPDPLRSDAIKRSLYPTAQTLPETDPDLYHAAILANHQSDLLPQHPDADHPPA